VRRGPDREDPAAPRAPIQNRDRIDGDGDGEGDRDGARRTAQDSIGEEMK
jgi:hypothetical protein